MEFAPLCVTFRLGSVSESGSKDQETGDDMPSVFAIDASAAGFSAGGMLRKTLLFACAAVALLAAAPECSRADSVGAAFGAGTGLLVAGPPGAIVGGVVGAVWGHPFWGPANSPQSCWIDNSFYRHCRYYRGRWHHY